MITRIAARWAFPNLAYGELSRQGSGRRGNCMLERLHSVLRLFGEQLSAEELADLP
ncbi:hypothetical protein PV336_13220 [Streptomyces sp. MI02-2A]|uniref:hypothetical protein n=1 Tax=unclassified Streptomyces TaxID=2593676 RepID=UPI000E37B0F7|nr:MULTISPECIES: hypothetical protein [unclassified Streptomyces]MDX3260179.1 hypothetical protein [Streptomyces sp. MI02-2A]REE64440.1 hypothetical protein BX257_7118 [Streptomyces sp. 3212.3]